MKFSSRVLFTICMLMSTLCSQAQAFDEWFRQKSTQKKYLIQQIAKLQLYLENVKKGYNIVNKGLTTIGDIKNGDLNLHSLFFNDLYQVRSPVKNYSKTREILTTVSFIKSKATRMKDLLASTPLYTDNERQFVCKQVDNMLAGLLEDVTMLDDILTNNTLEMCDNERLKRIDRIHVVVTEKKEWMNSMTYHCSILAAHRNKNIQDQYMLQELHKPVE